MGHRHNSRGIRRDRFRPDLFHRAHADPDSVPAGRTDALADGQPVGRAVQRVSLPVSLPARVLLGGRIDLPGRVSAAAELSPEFPSVLAAEFPSVFTAEFSAVLAAEFPAVLAAEHSRVHVCPSEHSFVRAGSHVNVAVPGREGLPGRNLPGDAVEFRDHVGRQGQVRRDGGQLRELAILVDKRQLRPAVSTVFELGALPEAFRAQRAGRPLGKVVISLGELPPGGFRAHPWADLASASISALSAFSCLVSIFCAFFIARSILAPMSATPTTTRPACPVSRCSPSSFRSWRLIPAAA